MTQPRIRIEPPRCSTDGKGAAMIMQAIGMPLDDFQQILLDAWLGKDENGNYNCTSAGVSLARQNGKNVAIEARELYGLLINGERILHTAHQLRTARRSFRRLAAMFQDKAHPEIMATVRKIRYGLGEESIELTNGGIIEFTSRSRQVARGFEGISLVVFDEAQELSEEAVEAILATLSASKTGTRQVIYAGTPCYPGCAGTVFKRFRENALAAKPGAPVAWHEWGVGSVHLKDIDLQNRDLWRQANPALLTGRLTEEFTAQELATLSPDGFARERLGAWLEAVVEEAAVDPAIDPEVWQACRSTEQRPEGKTAYGVKFSADGSRVALAGAVLPKDGPGRISVIETADMAQGLSWLSEWLNARYKQASAVAIDGRNGADVLINMLRPAGGGTWVVKDSLTKPTAQDMTTAASLLLNELRERRITWYAGQEALNDAALCATKRKIGQGWGFGGPDAELIEACSLALWACKTTKRNPQKKMRIG